METSKQKHAFGFSRSMRMLGHEEEMSAHSTRMPTSLYETVKQCATKHSESINLFIVKSLLERLQKEGEIDAESQL